ncbi:MAG: hypothetical protein K8T89_17510, partial [Planctomycetes bacterium]|nr:hypothetical protein [Planctomycetota bacterium]
LVYIEKILAPFSDEKVMPVWLNGSNLFKVADGVEMKWHKSGITIATAKDAKPGPRNLRIRYESFAFGTHLFGVRVVVPGEK